MVEQLAESRDIMIINTTTIIIIVIIIIRRASQTNKENVHMIQRRTVSIKAARDRLKQAAIIGLGQEPPFHCMVTERVVFCKKAGCVATLFPGSWICWEPLSYYGDVIRHRFETLGISVKPEHVILRAPAAPTS